MIFLKTFFFYFKPKTGKLARSYWIWWYGIDYTIKNRKIAGQNKTQKKSVSDFFVCNFYVQTRIFMNKSNGICYGTVDYWNRQIKQNSLLICLLICFWISSVVFGDRKGRMDLQGKVFFFSVLVYLLKKLARLNSPVVVVLVAKTGFEFLLFNYVQLKGNL